MEPELNAGDSHSAGFAVGPSAPSGTRCTRGIRRLGRTTAVRGGGPAEFEGERGMFVVRELAEGWGCYLVGEEILDTTGELAWPDARPATGTDAAPDPATATEPRRW